MRKLSVAVLIVALILAVGASVVGPATAAPVRISIATGGTGGVYFALGGGLASLITRHLPNVSATAEVTPASVDNMRLIGAGRADLAFTLADTAFDAFRGEGVFRGSPIPLRTLAPLYNNFNHLVTVEGTGITTLADLRGKRVSVGAPGSGTEITALRILAAAGIDPARDFRTERLGVAASVDALRDRRIDAFFWSGGLPTAAVLDLAATPGRRIHLVALDGVIPALQRDFGALYFRSVISREIYPGMAADVATISVANLLVVHERFDAELAYQITKLLFERRPELVAIHAEGRNITTVGAAARSPIPFHPGAVRFFREIGIEGF